MPFSINVSNAKYMLQHGSALYIKCVNL